MTLRVVLADDSTLIRDLIARVLRNEGVDVVGEVGNATALLEVVSEHKPDLAVVDIRMPSSDPVGIEAAMTIRANHPATAVLLLSEYIETDAAMKLLTDGEGGVGYLLKERASDDEFILAVKAVAAGGTSIDPILVNRMMNRPRRQRRPIDDLTDREREVLSLMAEGKSNHAIGVALHLSKRTVEAHTSAIFDKLGLRLEVDDNRRVLAVLTYLRSSGS